MHRQVVVNGRDVDLGDPRSTLAGGIGFVPDDRKRMALLPTRSVGENFSIAVEPAISNKGVLERARERKMVRDAIGRYGVVTASAAEPRSRRSRAATSRRSSSAAGFALEVEVLVFSEPTRGIDVGAKSEIYQLMQEAAADRRRHRPHLVGAARAARHRRSDRRVLRGRAPGRVHQGPDAGGGRRARRRDRRAGGLRRIPDPWRRHERVIVRRPDPAGGRAQDGRPGPIPPAAGGGSACRWAATPASSWRCSAVAIYLTITEPVFLTWDNLMNIVKSNSVIFVLAIGATFVVISGGIDLSTASATTATAMVFGLALNSGWSLVPALVAAIAFGLMIGLINGILIAKAHISFLVVTLGALSIWASFALVVNDGQTVSVFSASGFGPIKDFVNKDVGPFPILLIFDVIVVLVAGGVLRYTAFGRALFATGSNEEAARLNGISISRILIAVYAIAARGALAAVVQVGRLTAASATGDPTLLLTVLAAVLIGGTSFTGGEGGVLGTVIGVIFLGVIQNGLTLSGVSAFWQGTRQRRHPDRRRRPRRPARPRHQPAPAPGRQDRTRRIALGAAGATAGMTAPVAAARGAYVPSGDYTLIIGGEPVATDDGFDAIDPSVGTPWTRLPQATEAHVDAAVAAATRAFATWRRTTRPSASACCGRWPSASRPSPTAGRRCWPPRTAGRSARRTSPTSRRAPASCATSPGWPATTAATRSRSRTRAAWRYTVRASRSA